MTRTAKHTITLKNRRTFTVKLIRPAKGGKTSFKLGDISFEIGYRFRRPSADRSTVSWSTPYGTLYTRPLSIRCS